MRRVPGVLVAVVTLAAASVATVAQAAPPFEITLSRPASFIPGEPLSGPFTGALTAAGVGVPNQTIEIAVDGQPSATSATTLQGSYAASLSPFAGTADRTVTATAFAGTPFATSAQVVVEVVRYDLTVVRSGTGLGTVTSNPGGISCPGSCSASFAATTTVQLIAAPAANSTFSGWSGGGCTGTGACTVSMNAATMVTATFAINRHTLTVVRTGSGSSSGTVSSSPSGITCGADCEEQYNEGTTVVLTAAPTSNAIFTGWSGGGCTGTGTCVVAMNAPVSVTATFVLNQFTLSVARAGLGNGTVQSNPPGINCGPAVSDCTEAYTAGTFVFLTAFGDPNSTFAGWTGGPCSGTGACGVTMNSAVSVTATFVPTQYNLDVNVSGSGTVTSNPSGINCPSTCRAFYNSGTIVTLTASTDIFHTFQGWSGSGCSGTGTCTVSMSAARAVNATFS